MTRVDVHGHIGRWQDRDLTPEYVLGLMQGSGIDLALVSNLEGIGKETDQAGPNERTRQAVGAYPNHLRGLVWVNPWQSASALSNTRACLQLEHVFVGLKFHPFHNQFHFNSPEVRPFVQLAGEFGVPVAVHTAYDDYSQPEEVVAVAGAAEFAGVKFVLFHAGMNPPDAERGDWVFRQAAAHPNLYIDISWLELDRLRRAFDIVPLERILFGTDVPLGGDEHYREYYDKLDSLGLSDEQWFMLMDTNNRGTFTRLQTTTPA